jgi:hypothetical protein
MIDRLATAMFSLIYKHYEALRLGGGCVGEKSDVVDM